MWILFTSISILGYALSGVFEKMGSSLSEQHTELKLLVWFGIASGFLSILISCLGLRESRVTAFEMVRTTPVVFLSPLFYYLSLFLSFMAYKLIPVFVVAPIIGMEGVFTFIAVIIMFLLRGKTALLDESITPLKLVLVVLSLIGIYACGYIQNKTDDKMDNIRRTDGRKQIYKVNYAVVGVILAVFSVISETGSVLVDIYCLEGISDSFDYIFVHGIIIFFFHHICVLVTMAFGKKTIFPVS